MRAALYFSDEILYTLCAFDMPIPACLNQNSNVPQRFTYKKTLRHGQEKKMQRDTMLKKLSAVIIGAGLAGTVLAADIKLGAAEALTGPAAKYGIAIKNGFTLAADEVNAKGGVNGNKLVLVLEDEQGKKEEAINVFKKLIFQDKVLLVFGPTLSNSAFAAGPIANAAKVVA